MDVTEDFLGRIPGFYSLIIFTTVYLMLPMFQGADKVFRKILVPLAGLQELLLLRDAMAIKKRMLKDLDPERAAVLQKCIAKFFDGSSADSDPSVLKKELKQGWGQYKSLKMDLPFDDRWYSSRSKSKSGYSTTHKGEDVSEPNLNWSLV